MADDLARTLRWTPSDDGKGGILRLRRSRQIGPLLAMVWNLGLPQLTLGSKRFPPMFVVAGLLGASVFAYYFLRATLNTTQLRFEAGKFILRFGPFPPRERFEHVLSDIADFSVDRTSDVGEWKVVLVTRSGARLPLPVDVDAIVTTLRGSSEMVFGRAREEHVRFVADRLNESLDVARRENVQYRDPVVAGR